MYMENMSSKSYEGTVYWNFQDGNDLLQEGNANSNCYVEIDGIQQADVDSEREENADIQQANVDSEREEEDADTVKKMMDMTVDDILGLEFDSENEAWEFYRKYGKCRGFAIRKSDVDRDAEGNITMRELVCNKAGLRLKKHFMRKDRQRQPRKITRTDCKAKLRVRRHVRTHKWQVVQFIDTHNHELTSVDYVHLLAPNRSMSDAEKAQVDGCHIMGFMSGQKAGHKDLGFCQMDLYSHIDRERRAKIEVGDTFAALCYLQAKADNDPMQFIKFTTTDDGKLCNLFWSDTGSRIDFQCFGDVVAFDTTYKKNLYNKPLIIFSGSNHHGQTTVFACAFVADEKTETYMWVLEAFLEAMGNKHPQVVVTDGDDTMRDAIKAVFPNVVHRHCAWYLHNNAFENIKNPEFSEDFKKAIYSNFTPAEFEEYWKNMTEKYSLVDNEWIRKTYADKEMWASAYTRDKFFGRVRTTAICEGINSFIERYVLETNSLVDFMHNFECAVREYRNNEAIADFDSMYSKPLMTTALQEIERHAAKIYTRQIFCEVKTEIEDVGALNIVEKTGSSDNVTFKLNRFGKPNVEFEVKYVKTECKFSCDCRLFESRGIPCSHIFCCLKHEHIGCIPSSIICKRWTKHAKSDFIASSISESSNSDASFMLRFGALFAASNRLCQSAANDMEKFNEVLNEINKLTGMLEKRRRQNSKQQIGSPSAIGKRKYDWSRRQCSSCGRGGHNVRRCPSLISGGSGTTSNGDDVTSSSDDDTDNDVSIDNRDSVSHQRSDCVRQKNNGAGPTSSKRKQQKVKNSTQNPVNEPNAMTAEVTKVNTVRPATPVAPGPPFFPGYTVYPHWSQFPMYAQGCWDGRLPQVQRGIHNGPGGNLIPLFPSDGRNQTPGMQKVDKGPRMQDAQGGNKGPRMQDAQGIHNVQGGNKGPRMQDAQGIHNVQGGNKGPQMQDAQGVKDGPEVQQGGSVHKNV